MTRRRIELDFVRRRLLSRSGAILFAAGMVAALLTVADYRAAGAAVAGVELRLDALDPAQPAVRDEAADRVASEAAAAIADLATPWTVLLRELELAGADSKGSVAALAVAPDRNKREVAVLAEARTLTDALAYVERLQRSAALRHPMLASHEVQTREAERPVRFEIKSEWSTTP
jgi:hypothetical protein